jgi:hypothetical protein
MKPKLIRPTDEEDAAITAAALSDPDNLPLTDAELAQFKRMRSQRRERKMPTTVRFDELVVVAKSQRYKKAAGLKTSGKSQHVIPHSGKWAVLGAGNLRVTSVHPTLAAAIKRAREIAQKQHSEVVIYGEDGKIREKSSYGNDP